jgi:hypothetical protein
MRAGKQSHQARAEPAYLLRRLEEASLKTAQPDSAPLPRECRIGLQSGCELDDRIKSDQDP